MSKYLSVELHRFDKRAAVIGVHLSVVRPVGTGAGRRAKRLKIFDHPHIRIAGAGLDCQMASVWSDSGC
jgi:hypothetical protein